MKETNYWDRFLATGSINDFLSYKNLSFENAGNVAGKETAAGTDVKDGRADDPVTGMRSGGHSHAGVYRDYGNDFEG